MKDLYETKYNIFNHHGAGKVRPLASVAFHPAEDFITGSRLRETAELYAKARIYDAYKLSFHEFISLPFDVAQEYCEMAPMMLKHSSPDSKMLQDLQAEIGKNK